MQDFMIMLLICSVTMSALALLYMMATPLLAKYYSEKGLYYAWFVIVIGLIFPFRPQWDSAIVKVDIPIERTMNIAQIGGETPATIPMTMPIDTVALSPGAFSISWWQIGFAVWLAGMLVFLAYHIIKHYYCMKMAQRWSENITNEQVLTLFQSLKEEMGITQKIELYLCSSVGSPMMIGFIKPRIFLPTISFAQDELRFILKHELVHHKRKDLLYKYLVLVVAAIHWFNPVVYLVVKAINELCEMSCDTEVVKGADADTRQHYSETIIGVVKYRSNLQTVLSTHFYGGKKGMKNRISSIMDTSKKKAGSAIICMAIVITIGTGFAFAATANTAEAVEAVNTAYANVAANSITLMSPETTEQRAERFEVYKEFGLTYDTISSELYFNGELIRYFEDYFPVTSDGNAGINYFNENGTIDIHGVRDLSQIAYNDNGSYDPSGKLIGVEPYSQAEFDAKDISNLKNHYSTGSDTFKSTADDGSSVLSVSYAGEKSMSRSGTSGFSSGRRIDVDMSNNGLQSTQTQSPSSTEHLASVEILGITFEGYISKEGGEISISRAVS
jgi:beta-lactamase regulating signal transducer with metallopeptidase domain